MLFTIGSCCIFACNVTSWSDRSFMLLDVAELVMLHSRLLLHGYLNISSAHFADISFRFGNNVKI